MVSVRLYADDVREVKGIARADATPWHSTLRELVRLGIEERKRRDAARTPKPPQVM